MMLSLFVEELSNNIIQFGFDGNKKRSIDVRVIRLDSGWMLRMRDTGDLLDQLLNDTTMLMIAITQHHCRFFYNLLHD